MPNECYFPFHHNGKTYTKCTSDGTTHPWCATVVKRDPQSKLFMMHLTMQIIILSHSVFSDPVPVMSTKGGSGWEGWGYCGNCRKEGRSPQCAQGGHTVLNQAWRAVTGEDMLLKEHC